MKTINKISLTSLFLALGLILPFFTGQIPMIGNMLLPMHFPVFLCAFFCGYKYALGLGFILPLLRSFLFSMPYFYPNAVAMAFELATYGAICGGLFHTIQPKSLKSIYFSLISSMIGGRIVWGIVQTILLGMAQKTWGFQIFLTQALLNASLGIIIQLILVPSLVYPFVKKCKI